MKYFFYLLVAFITFSFACNDPDDGTNPDPDKKDSTENEVEWPEQVNLEAESLYEGWINPWGIAFIDTHELIITERAGRLYHFNEETKARTEIKGLVGVISNGQGGLLDVVAHPDYENNNLLYFTYAKNVAGGGSNTAFARAELSGFELTNWEVLYEATPGSNNGTHYGSRIVFDGEYVYISLGERGRPDNSQDRSNANGCVLRFYHDGTIPTDNPYIDSADVLDEIYSYGHRNPQGMVLHPTTGKVWLHEHGPKGGDEINIVAPAANYGWPLVTFGINYNGTVISEDTTGPGITDPIHYWDPSIAPCGMAFFTHPRYGQYNEELLIGALAHRKLQVCFLKGDDVRKEEDHMVDFARFRDVKMSPDGYMYVVCEAPGHLLKLIPEPVE
ncbi:MAG: PQQ-dependent sugar dehydrogenase [Bacteroidia bacterium]